MYGIGNIIQNAIEHAKKFIDVNISWSKLYLFIKITDDGNGFTKEILDSIGNPFISKNKNDKNIGLGIFIAKNLIENVGGKIKFLNKLNTNGSIVEIHLNKNI